MDNATTLPTDVPTLHLMLREQQQLIESLKANLHRLLKWRFGPKSELLDVDQFGLFADGSLVIGVPVPEPAAEAKQAASTAPPAERRRVVRVLKSLPRVVERIGFRPRRCITKPPNYIWRRIISNNSPLVAYNCLKS